MREIRQSGSVRGVRRNPYPYRDGNSGFVVGSKRYRGVVWQNIFHAGSRVVRGDIGHPEPLAG